MILGLILIGLALFAVSFHFKLEGVVVSVTIVTVVVIVGAFEYNTTKPRRFVCFSEANSPQKLLVAMPPPICTMKAKKV